MNFHPNKKERKTRDDLANVDNKGTFGWVNFREDEKKNRRENVREHFW